MQDTLEASAPQTMEARTPASGAAFGAQGIKEDGTGKEVMKAGRKSRSPCGGAAPAEKSDDRTLR